MSISAKIVGDSICNGNRITSLEVIIPRIVLAEFNTHRMFSRNSASSRAIPAKKMIEAVERDPFIPIAWQKDHKGMQGSEYFDDSIRVESNPQSDSGKLLREWHKAKNLAVEQSTKLHEIGLTKQLCNRLLEPFMYHKVLVTSTEWENFFELRAPAYRWQNGKVARSWKDLVKDAFNEGASRDWVDSLEEVSTLERLKNNTSQAEIHIQAVAEYMWDAINESKPKELQPGEWHIPYNDKIDSRDMLQFTKGEVDVDDPLFHSKVEPIKIKLSTVMAARTSYTVVGSDQKPLTYERMIEIHDEMKNAKPFHASPFEHCARAMTSNEFYSFVRGIGAYAEHSDSLYLAKEDSGWCRNFKGFIQYRHLIETNEI